MATLRTAIALYDGVTSPLQHMTTAMNIVINSFEHMQTASGNSIDTAAWQTARSEMAQVSTALDGIENNIRQSDQQQQRFNSDIRSGTTAADGLWSKIKGYTSAFAGLYGVQQTLGISDQLSQSKARLSLIVDDGGSVAALQKKIMDSANASRSSYLDVTKTVSKLGILAGNAFSNSDELIKFNELMNKNFVIGGAAAEEQTAAMYQLTQSMASGRLQGDEFRTIREDAPLLAKAINNYMKNAGVPGTMQDWSAQGLLTADVIKAAMFNSADEVDARFAEMPVTWGQRWTLMKNEAIQVFDPILTKINQVANSKRFNTVFSGIVHGLAAIATVAIGVFGVMTTIGAGIVDNWSWIAPLILGIVAVLGVLKIAQIINNTLAGEGAIAAVAHAVASGAETAAIIALTLAQDGLNAALALCPITWIVIAIILLVAIIYAACAAIAHFTGVAETGFGVICGAVLVAAAFIGNVFIGSINGLIQLLWTIFVEPFIGIIEWVLNVANGGFDSFGDAVKNLLGNIISWFLSLGEVVTKIIDAIFGTDWTSGLESLKSSVLSWGKNENSITLDRSAPTIDYRFNYGNAWDTGSAWGDGAMDKLSGLFDGSSTDIPAYNDSSALGDTAANTADTAANTAAMKDSLSTSEENLKYLREIAERQAIDQYTTAEINLVMQNENHISSDVDLDGFINELEKRTEEAILEVSERVHV